MEQTIILARMFSVLNIAVGLGIVINRNFYESVLKNFRDNPAVMYVAGIFTLILGFALVAIHNEWSGGWPVLITVICWLIMIKGIVILAFPMLITKLAACYIEKPNRLVAQGVFAILFSALLLYVSFAVQ